MTEFAGYSDTGGVERYISTSELLTRPEVQGYAVDNLEKTYRADDAVWAEEHDDGSVTLDVSFAEGGLIDRHGDKLTELINDIESGYMPNLAWSRQGAKVPLGLTSGAYIKPSITVRTEFSPHGEVTEFTIFRSTIHAEARERKDFEEELDDAQPGDELWPLKKASRFTRSNPQTTEMVDEVWRSSNRSRFSDFSILTNTVVSNTMFSQNIPWLYRNYHPKHPFEVGDIHEHDLPEVIERLIEEVGSAYYTAQPIRHDGLDLHIYGYSTGQLARLPNIVNGVMLTHWFDGSEPPISHDDIATLARWLNTKKFDGNARKRYPEVFTLLEVSIELDEIL